ncbi:hypothetical protein PCE1_002359 [Barthelona sp. PCE]
MPNDVNTILSREEDLTIRAEALKFHEKTRQLLEEEAKKVRHEEAERLAQELSEANRYQVQALRFEERVIAEEERAKLEQQQAQFLQAENERAAALRKDFLNTQEKYLRMEAENELSKSRQKLAEELSQMKKQKELEEVHADETMEYVEDEHIEPEPMEEARETFLPKRRKGKKRLSPRKNKKAKVLLLMTVDVGDGRSDVITVCENDSYHDLASDFVRKHGLNGAIVEPLAQKIAENVGVLQPEQPTTPNFTRKREEKVQRPKSHLTPRERDEFFHHLSQVQPRRMTERKKKRAKELKKEESLAVTGSPSVLEFSSVLANVRHKKKKHTGSVFDRLYSEAVEVREKKREVAEQEKEKIRQQSMRNSSVKHTNSVSQKIVNKKRKKIEQKIASVVEKPVKTVADRLYYESLLRKKDLEEKQRKLKEERRKSEMTGCTFRPKVSKKAKELEREGEELWQRIIDPYGHQRDHILKATREDKINKAIAKLPFKPKLSKRSERLASKVLGDAIMDPVMHAKALYSDAKRREQRARDMEYYYEEDCTFAPEVNVNSPVSKEEREKIIDRLLNSKRYTDEQLVSLRSQLESNVDPKTGQELFTPMTGRGPAFERNTANLDIGEFLYESRHEFDDVKRLAYEAEMEEIRRKADGKKTNDISDKLVLSRRANCLYHLYSYINQGNEYNAMPTDYDMLHTEGLSSDICSEVRMVLDHVQNQEKISPNDFVDLVFGIFDAERTYVFHIFSFKTPSLRTASEVAVEDFPFSPAVDHTVPEALKESVQEALANREEAIAKHGGVHSKLYSDAKKRKEDMKRRIDDIIQSEKETYKFSPQTSPYKGDGLGNRVESNVFARLTADINKNRKEEEEFEEVNTPSQ